MAENNAIEANTLLSDFSDEAADAGTGTEMRAAFGMSGSPNEMVFNIPALRDVFADATKVQCDSRVPQNTSTGRGNLRPQLRCDFLLDRADPIHDFSKFHSPAISRRACGKPAAPHSTKISPA
jgi:hypothetical protein